ncbi:unnamed protein product [Adineta steineri]|uniref:Uncharacterized protein n=1 Tax=Adineta steineri TaxID=433720 RepID=A0A814PUN8_9BILA|nr:unnamed protein product [Adineta steineri]CAF1111181.1 unnamed protein product [Adineta steineri]
MAMANNNTQCFTCHEENNTYTCKTCSNELCFIHLPEHQQRLNKELYHIIDHYNIFKERIDEQKQHLHNNSLMKQIHQSEINSTEIIQQTPKDCREIVRKSSQTYTNDIEMKFNDIREQIKQMQNENGFSEINLNHLRSQLFKITEELNNLPNIPIHHDSQAFISEVSIISEKKPKFNKWKQNAITAAAGNGSGHKLNQCYRPGAIFIDKKKNIFIADTYNHRITEWKCTAKEGLIIAGGNGSGSRMSQLNQPKDVIVDQKNHSIIIADFGNKRVIQWMNRNQRIIIDNIDCCGLAIDKHGFLYVSDSYKNEVKRWKMGEYNEGIVVAGGNEKGDQLSQLNSPGYIFVDKDQSVHVSDRYNHRVMKWRKGAKEGTIVAGGNGFGQNLNQLSYPYGVIVDNLDQIYVVDSGNNRIMGWCEGKEEGKIVVGGNGQGNQSNQLNKPMGLSLDNEGNLYVVDCGNHRIQKFELIL